MIIQYAVGEDRIAAELIQRKVGGRVIQYDANNPYVTSEDIIIVSGQIANATYRYYMNLGYIPEIRRETAGTGFVYVAKRGAQKIYAVAGWNRIDTLAAAAYVMEFGLPSYSVQVGSFHELHLITWSFDEEGLILKVASKLASLINWLEDRLPIENRLVWSGIRDGKYLEILVSTNSPIAETTLLGLVALALTVVCGIVAYHRGRATIQDVEKNAFVEKLTAVVEAQAYLIGLGYTPQQASDAVNTAIQNFKVPTMFEEIKGIIKYVLILGIVGTVTYTLIAYAIPALLPKPKKPKKAEG